MDSKSLGINQNIKKCVDFRNRKEKTKTVYIFQINNVYKLSIKN